MGPVERSTLPAHWLARLREIATRPRYYRYVGDRNTNAALARRGLLSVYSSGPNGAYHWYVTARGLRVLAALST